MKAAIFDLDGTLADTALDLMLAGNATYKDMGIEYRLEVGKDEGISSKGGRSTIRHGLCEAFGMAEEDRVHALYPTFLKNYEHVLDVNSYLYEGVVKTLDAILEMEIVLGVCTNKPQKQAKILLDKLGILTYFNAIVGPDTFGLAKPKPDPLINIIKMLGSTPKCSVLVGDTSTDLLTCDAADVSFILATYGHGVKYQNLNPACTKYTVSSPLELPKRISQIFKKS